jgi:hypothetical protein
MLINLYEDVLHKNFILMDYIRTILNDINIYLRPAKIGINLLKD